MNCKFCNHNVCKIEKDIISPHNSQKYHLYSCKQCGCFFFNIGQYSVSLNSFYNELALTRGIFHEDFVPSKSWRKQVQTIKKLLGRNPRSVLDVGCRTGDFLMHFNNSTECDGVELSHHYASIAQNRGIKVHNDLLENIEFKKKYDIVTLFAIMEHLELPFKFMDQLNSIVNKGGILVILIPSHESLERKWFDFIGKTWHMYSPPEHLNFFSREFLDQYFAKKGFILIHRYYTSGGMINVFPKVPLINKLLKKFITIFDNSLLSKLAVFDHMYCYYQLKRQDN